MITDYSNRNAAVLTEGNLKAATTTTTTAPPEKNNRSGSDTEEESIIGEEDHVIIQHKQSSSPTSLNPDELNIAHSMMQLVKPSSSTTVVVAAAKKKSTRSSGRKKLEKALIRIPSPPPIYEEESDSRSVFSAPSEDDDDIDMGFGASQLDIDGAPPRPTIEQLVQAAPLLGLSKLGMKKYDLIKEKVTKPTVGKTKSRRLRGPKKECSTPKCFNLTTRVDGLCKDHLTLRPPGASSLRRSCKVAGCKTLARTFGLCKKHGGSKKCSYPGGCDSNVQSKGLCIRHGGGSRCKVKNCDRAAQSRGVCKVHGGGVPCSVEGCNKKAHAKRLCRAHGGGSRCATEGCTKWSQRQKLCMSCWKRVGLLPATDDDVAVKALMEDEKKKIVSIAPKPQPLYHNMSSS